MHDDFYQMYLEELKAIIPCTKEEQEQLAVEAAAGSVGAKRRLEEGCLELALACAKEYDGKGVLLTDLVQEANMALVMAVEACDTEWEGQDFEGFAVNRIHLALEAAVEEEAAAGLNEEELTARVNVLQTVSQALAEKLGREATIEELAEMMKMSVDEIREIMKMAIEAMSMNAENMDLEDLSEMEGIKITDEMGTMDSFDGEDED